MVLILEDILQWITPLISAAATCIIGYFFKKLKEIADKRELEELASRNVLIGLCRDRILHGYRYYRQHGGISSQDLETMTNLYNAYHALGGNDTITTIYEKIKHLPIKEGEM